MGLVYDSATGGMCPRCRKRLDRCGCARQVAANARPVTDGVVRVRREQRNGKAVTVVFDLPLNADELAALFADPAALAEMGRRAWESARPDAAGTIADELIALVG